MSALQWRDGTSLVQRTIRPAPRPGLQQKPPWGALHAVVVACFLQHPGNGRAPASGGDVQWAILQHYLVGGPSAVDAFVTRARSANSHRRAGRRGAPRSPPPRTRACQTWLRPSASAPPSPTSPWTATSPRLRTASGHGRPTALHVHTGARLRNPILHGCEMVTRDRYRLQSGADRASAPKSRPELARGGAAPPQRGWRTLRAVDGVREARTA
jgi:hypothetical protein